MSARLSKLDVNSRIQDVLLQAQVDLSANLTKLYASWMRMGFSGERLVNRESTVGRTIRQTIEAIVDQEDEYEQRKIASVEKYGQEYHVLAKELGVSVVVLEQDQGLLQLEKELKEAVHSLREAKEKRMSELRSLCNEDTKVCERLAIATFPVDKDKLPSQEEIDELKKHINEVSAELDKREARFLEFRERIVNLLSQLDAVPDSSLEVSTVCEPVDKFTFSDENMAAVKKYYRSLEHRVEKQKERKVQLVNEVNPLWKRLDIPVQHQTDFTSTYDGLKASDMKAWEDELERCKQLKRQNLQIFVERVREELENYWDRCMVGTHARSLFAPMKSDDWSESLLELHELEVTKYQSLYGAHKEIFLKVKRREDLFNRMVDLEARAKDPDRLFGNRGGALLLEEKERKKILKDLPKVEEELEVMLHDYKQSYGQILVIFDANYSELMKQQWAKYESEKENEKQQRAKARAKQLESEVKGGSKPSTPIKRRLGTTQSTHTASPKMRRLEIGGPSNVMETRQKLSTKTPVTSLVRQGSTLRHASRKVLQEHVANVQPNDPCTPPNADTTVASIVTTYSDFTHALEEKARRDDCRSSVLMKNQFVNSTVAHHSRLEGPSTVPRRRSPRLALLRTPGTPRSNLRFPRTPLSNKTNKSPTTLRRNLALAKTPSGLPFLV